MSMCNFDMHTRHHSQAGRIQSQGPSSWLLQLPEATLTLVLQELDHAAALASAASPAWQSPAAHSVTLP
jgi:hypothetical protein